MSRYVIDHGRIAFVTATSSDDGPSFVMRSDVGGHAAPYTQLDFDAVDALRADDGAMCRLVVETGADLAARPAADDAGSLHAQIADLTRRLADAEAAVGRLRGELATVEAGAAVEVEKRRAALRRLETLDAAVRHIACGGALGDVVVRGLSSDVVAALGLLHPQPPHGGAADVERAPLLSVVGRLYYASDRMQVLGLDGGDLLASVVLPPGVARASAPTGDAGDDDADEGEGD